ncbi:thermonuclease family protein [Saccharibacillus alkalitolerans]|uniref:Thermonuclease family protein n=1 Tax=Saccharibacillus alkalitolerans TaxID=2705290 RepID=A0ABX0FAZ0_9BACL|nr:thermonuclease family protein [Saccharibacillus alkalitolerans]NGZ77224.1 thermonuclease family protein [Saccharibacillus alkalitolerans]
MKTPGDRDGGNGSGRPKRSLLSIAATVIVLGLLLFTDAGRSLLGNLLNGDEAAQTQSDRTSGRAGSEDAPASNDEPAAEGRVAARVERTVDGDTFIATLDDGSRERVRMLLIDTPETKKEGTPVQPFGPEASDYAKKRLTGKAVELEFDEEQRDQYDRMLAYVYLDGERFNEKLLEQGLARVVVYKPNDKYADEFRSVEAEAKRKKLGVWSIDGYADKRGFHPEAAE